MPYLIKLNQADAAWRAIADKAKDYSYEWERSVNSAILEMFILRHKAYALLLYYYIITSCYPYRIF